MRLLSADFVERLVHFGHDVEAVEDMQSFGAFFADRIQSAFIAKHSHGIHSRRAARRDQGRQYADKSH